MACHQQLLYHVVFSTKHRQPLFQDDHFRETTWSYMAGVVKNLEGFALNIGGHYDHAHLLIRIPAKIAVAEFVGKIKANTSKHINERGVLSQKFHWQAGYGAFTVSPSKKDQVFEYIDAQMEHHRRLTYQEEFLQMLDRHGIEFDPKYLWE